MHNDEGMDGFTHRIGHVSLLDDYTMVHSMAPFTSHGQPFNNLEGDKNNALQKREEMKKKCLESDINLPHLESIMKKNVKIDKIWGRLCYFNERNYANLSQEIFCSLCKKYLPDEILQKMCSVKIFKSLYQYISYDFTRDNKKDYAENFFISFENGVVDASELYYDAHSEDIEVSYTINANYIEDEECPIENFENFIYFMTGGDRESIQLIWEMLGYVMLHVSPKRAFFWLGTEPASGKSLLGDFIQRLFGIENCCQIEADDIGKRFSMSQFISKRVNLGMESSGRLTKSDVVRLKELTGNRTISIEQKGIDRLDYPNFTVLIFASNDAISIGDCDLTDAFWERCKLIPCIQSCPIEDRDPNLLEKIWEERDGIVSKAVREVNQLIQRDFRFTEPQLARQMKAEWRNNSSAPIVAFASECLEIIPRGQGQVCFTTTEELHMNYIAYTGDNISKNVFSNQFNRYFSGKIDKGKKRIKGYCSPVNGYFNVRIKKLNEET